MKNLHLWLSRWRSAWSTDYAGPWWTNGTTDLGRLEWKELEL